MAQVEKHLGVALSARVDLHICTKLKEQNGLAEAGKGCLYVYSRL